MAEQFLSANLGVSDKWSGSLEIPPVLVDIIGARPTTWRLRLDDADEPAIRVAIAGLTRPPGPAHPGQARFQQIVPEDVRPPGPQDAIPIT